MNNHTLSPKQYAAILALLSGANNKEAAEKAGVHPNRIAEWMRDPAFTQALMQAQREAMERMVRLLLAEGEASISAMRTVRDDPKASPMVKLRAAEMFLDKLLRLSELVTLEQRVADLEALANAEP